MTSTDSDGEVSIVGYAYTISSGSYWYNYVKTYADTESNGLALTASTATDSDGYVIYNVSVSDDFDAESFANYLGQYISDATEAGSVEYSDGSTDENGNVTGVSKTISNLDSGYYLVVSTLGSIMMLDTTSGDVTINEKNPTPAAEKEVLEDSTGTYGESNTADIGDTVSFKISISNVAGSVNLVLHDTLSNGLTLDENSINIAVYVPSGTDESGNTTYTSSTLGSDYYKVTISSTATDEEGNSVTTPEDGCSFEIEFDDDYLAGLTSGSYFVVTYSATVNSSAIIGSDGNNNKTYVSYGDSGTSTEDETKTYVYEVSIYKYTGSGDNETALAGAVFYLEKIITVTETDDEGNETTTETIYYAVVSDGKLSGWTTSVKNATKLTSDENGSIEVEGLDADTYYLG